MRIGVAQTKPVAGDIAANIDQHQRLIQLAVARSAKLIVFPELSITGYEPTLAGELAVDETDRRFQVFQSLCDAHGIAVGIGAPTSTDDGLHISAILFQPGGPRRVYSKMHLHSSEEQFFVPGPKSANLIDEDGKVALAICYELSVPEHAANASRNGAEIYLASVADTVTVIERVHARLAAIARDYAMTVLLANHVGTFAGREAAGKTAVWNNRGDLLGQLDGSRQGVIVVDAETQKATCHYL